MWDGAGHMGWGWWLLVPLIVASWLLVLLLVIEVLRRAPARASDRDRDLRR